MVPPTFLRVPWSPPNDPSPLRSPDLGIRLPLFPFWYPFPNTPGSFLLLVPLTLTKIMVSSVWIGSSTRPDQQTM